MLDVGDLLQPGGLHQQGRAGESRVVLAVHRQHLHSHVAAPRDLRDPHQLLPRHLPPAHRPPQGTLLDDERDARQRPAVQHRRTLEPVRDQRVEAVVVHHRREPGERRPRVRLRLHHRRDRHRLEVRQEHRPRSASATSPGITGRLTTCRTNGSTTLIEPPHPAPRPPTRRTAHAADAAPAPPTPPTPPTPAPAPPTPPASSPATPANASTTHPEPATPDSSHRHTQTPWRPPAELPANRPAHGGNPRPDRSANGRNHTGRIAHVTCVRPRAIVKENGLPSTSPSSAARHRDPSNHRNARERSTASNPEASPRAAPRTHHTACAALTASNDATNAKASSIMDARAQHSAQKPGWDRTSGRARDENSWAACLLYGAAMQQR